MPTCCAYGCLNRERDKIRGLTFHRFPQEESIRQQWISALRVVPTTKWLAICSAHFKESDIDRTSKHCVRLREGAVPSIYRGFPSSSQCSNEKLSTTARKKGRRQARRNKGQTAQQTSQITVKRASLTKKIDSIQSGSDCVACEATKSDDFDQNIIIQKQTKENPEKIYSSFSVSQMGKGIKKQLKFACDDPKYNYKRHKQKLGKRTSQLKVFEPTSMLHHAGMKLAREESDPKLGKQTEQKVRKQTEQGLRQQIEQELRQKIEQDLRQKIEQELRQQIEQELSQCTEQELTQQTEQELSQHTEQELSQCTVQELSQCTEQELSQRTEQELSQRTEQELSQELTQQTEPELLYQTEQELRQQQEDELEGERFVLKTSVLDVSQLPSSSAKANNDKFNKKEQDPPKLIFSPTEHMLITLTPLKSGEPFCDKVINLNIDSLLKHSVDTVGDKVTEICIYMCDICSQSFSHKRDLQMHKIIHVDAMPQLCGLCGKSFKTSKLLKHHAVVHTNQKDQLCEVCGKGFRFLDNLQRHQSTVHCKIRRFACNICSKTFTRSSHLKDHMFTHQPGQDRPNKKEFLCDTCGKSFDQSYIKLHKMTHTGKKTLECQVCGKGFPHYKAFKEHKLMHAGQKP